MIFNANESIDMVSVQIKQAKARGKKTLKIKTYQVDYSGDTPKQLYELVGMCEGGVGEQAIKKLGYNVSYETNTKQVTVGYRMTGEINKCKVNPLHTTSMVIKL